MINKAATEIVSRETFAEKLSASLKFHSLKLSDEMMENLYNFYSKILFWNKTHNLTRITDIDSFIEKHIIDSLIPLKIEGLNLEGKSIADVGSGGGFPGMPLSIALPSSRFTLIDKVMKKTNFLFTTATEIGLKNVSATHSLIEDIDEKFDVVTLRAVNVSTDFIATLKSRISPGGKLVLYLSGNQDVEIYGDQSKDYFFSISDFDRKITVISF